MDSAIDIAVIPVAGLGTRLLPATKSQPKEMLPVGRKPVVQYVVEELTRVGITRVHLLRLRFRGGKQARAETRDRDDGDVDRRIHATE